MQLLIIDDTTRDAAHCGLRKTICKLKKRVLQGKFLIFLKPDESADEMDESHESFCQFVVASRNSAEFFDSTKEPLHFLPHLRRASLRTEFENGHRGSGGLCRRLTDSETGLARLAIQG